LRKMMKSILVSAAIVAGASAADNKRTRPSEVWSKEKEAEMGIVHNKITHVKTMPTSALPTNFTWGDKDGVNYLTMSRNQHLPQYCGSCWAHGAISALGDRIKIARGAKGIDINLSVQHMLNCGNVGSCYGGSVAGPYQWIKSNGNIAYETENPYMACSSDSDEGFCGHADWTCNDMNVARTCSTFSENGGKCVGLNHYPNATITSYGSISGADDMAKEIYTRGPISCGIDAAPILDYKGGISSLRGSNVDHVISVVGWGTENGKEYWIVRNSWGEYWGEMGYIRVEKGNNALHLEDECAWAVPGDFTEGPAGNYPCNEGGENCQ